ncbi:MAG: penicillin-binding protein activator LpoB [Sinobacterium sp.]|nr:penicillin-binding protein activator LpoB [Sinobacterium sp.]
MKISTMNMMLMTLLSSILVLSACTSTKYGDAQATETVNTDFGSTDLQGIATKMVDDLLIFPPVVQMTAERRPVMFVDTIKNKTTEHIDTESITDSIQSKLLQSGKFRFVDMTAVKQVQDQLNYQQNSGMVNNQQAVAVGKQVGAEFMLYGNLSSIVKKDGSTKDVYYKFTLKMTNLETGILEWSGEKEIRKTKSRGWIGL